MKLTHEQHERAKSFIFTHGRPLERALYAYYFEQGVSETVYEQLGQFQHPNGGFGYALEPDFRASDASALATSVALQTLRDLQAPVEHSQVRGAIQYLLATYDQSQQRWSIIPTTANDAPHAPWWEYDGLAQRFGNFLANPRAEIVGYLYDYAELVPHEMLHALSEAVVAHLEAQPDQMEMHDLLCYLRLAETQRLPEAVRTAITHKLQCVVAATVARDPVTWQDYGLQPVAVVQSPTSPFARMFSSEIDLNLDFVIEQQQPNGAWTPGWSWAETHPDAWVVTEQEWSGVLTLHNLRTLHAFGRLA